MNTCVRSGLVAALLSVTSMVTMQAFGQANPPDSPDAPAAPSNAPTPSAGPVALAPMPPPDPANFTAATPTKATVEAFLRASWGYDQNRIFPVQAIQKTQIDGISRVIVLVEEKGT